MAQPALEMSQLPDEGEYKLEIQREKLSDTAYICLHNRAGNSLLLNLIHLRIDKNLSANIDFHRDKICAQG
jgi:hypothetical protein